MAFPRHSTFPLRHAPALLLLALAGGAATLGGDITASPADWSAYDGDTVRVSGNAGNSPLGPIVRFQDGGYVALRSFAPWSIDNGGRPVEVKGKIVPGTGYRAEKYVLDVTDAAVMPAQREPTKFGP